MTLAPGQVIGDDFELVRQLGEGGMGVVWLAIEHPLSREVALKIMRPSDSASRARRFEREARALAALDNPSIIAVLRTGEDAASGLRYIATPAILLSPEAIRHICDDILHCPYPEGFGRETSSQQREPLTLDNLLNGGKALPQAAVACIARDIAGALSAAHAAGILHRDVKPSNILFDADGRAMLADFGLAKFLSGTNGALDEDDGRTLDGADTISLDGAGIPKFIGSPAYAAPESFRKGAASASKALDWYSFGAVLHRALTGDRPGSLRAPSSYDPDHISRAWDALLRDLLDPDPTHRLCDSAAIMRRLAGIGNKPSRLRLPLAAALAAVLLALAAAIFVWTAAPGHPTSIPVNPAESEEPSPVPPIQTLPVPLPEEPEFTPPPLTPAATPLPPRLNTIWQGENRGALQLLNVFRMPVVDDVIVEALSGTEPETELIRKGDAAWSARKRDCKTAFEFYSSAYERFQGDSMATGAVERVRLAVALTRLSWVFVFTAKHGYSDTPYAKAIDVIAPLAETDPARYAPLLSWLFSERGYMECMEGRFEESVLDLEKALEIWESRALRSLPGCAMQEAVLLASIGGLWHIGEQNVKAIAATGRAIALAQRLSDSSPDQRLTEFLAGCHYRRGEVARALKRRQEAIDDYYRACELWKSLGAAFQIAYVQALTRVSTNLFNMQEWEKCAECTAEYTAILKQQADRDPGQYRQHYIHALRNKAVVLKKLGDVAGAQACEDEANAQAAEVPRKRPDDSTASAE